VEVGGFDAVAAVTRTVSTNFAVLVALRLDRQHWKTRLRRAVDMSEQAEHRSKIPSARFGRATKPDAGKDQA
jgi:hypothetical protein